MSEWIYSFGDGVADGDGTMKSLLGGKGAGLAQMTALGLPVPPGFTITTAACSHYFGHGQAWPETLSSELDAALAKLEGRVGRKLGDASDPLLVSVRSGAAVSMPGMMDTVLNLGLNDETVQGLANQSANARFAWDSYRRFVQMFGDVVLGIHYTRFARAQKAFIEQLAAEGKVDSSEANPSDLDVAQLTELTRIFQQVVADAGSEFPQEPKAQLAAAIDAVFKSYNSHRARYYRKTQGIPDDAGTGVNIQAMVFGNLGDGSGTGVAFTRNPKDGRRGLFGEWLPNAQGEDVVAGIRTPLPLNGNSDREGLQLEEAMPAAYAKLVEVEGILEAHYRDMQDIEFTVERDRLFMLQTRTGKRTALAGVQIAVDMVSEGLITEEEALSRIDPGTLELVLRPIISPDAKKTVIAKGLDASPGAACGRVVFEPTECQELYDRDEPSILVRLETSPEDIQGMTVAEGILTARGGQTSHAAVVARGMGKPCVVGCTDIQVDYSRELFYAGDFVVRKGDWITIDGGTGEVMEGKVEMLAPQSDSGALNTLLEWADARARLKVRANADTGPDAARARELGAVGIGLCRTEHMFFQPDALRAMRQMILADDLHSRQRALNVVLPIQREMFAELFVAMDGLPVTIRLLDPPLHEFLPEADEDIAGVAEDLGVRVETLHGRLQQLHESNPMLGHRGVRVGVTSPEVYKMQARAIFEAACQVTKDGIDVIPEVMIPLVGMPAELEMMRDIVTEVAEKVLGENQCRLEYKIGTMIEIPRAVLLADQIAGHADFFSFGTNDLTQLTYGFSRDDMGKFFPDYQRRGLLPDSPLAVFDIEGVGQLVKMGTERGRSTHPGLKVGVCGEHGGDPKGVSFFHKVGLDYVSCSPYRVPVARLAAAHAALGLL
ncbi:MAG: pyruvate, phosphate dikinase [Deltaproteobacteria bacterium]|nr:MAG: pyruvate, phosphate dikinase [Deltaproteobacteria bacterium]